MLMILTVVKYINSFIENLFGKLIFYILMAEFEDRFLTIFLFKI